MLPPSITPLSASSITSPSSLLIVTPNAGDVSSIVAPGSSVPSVGITPSSGASSVIPPSGSVNDPTSSVTPPGGSSAGIVPPGGSVGGSSGGKVQPLGGKYDATGECVQDKVRRDCTTSKDLMRQSIKLAIKIERGLGTEQDNIDLARNTTILAARETMPDKTADDYVRRLSNSPLYKSLEPKERSQMWIGLTLDFANGKLDKAGFGDRVYGAENSVVVRDGSGRIIGATAITKKVTVSSDPSIAIAGGFGKGAKPGIFGLILAAFLNSSTESDERAAAGATALIRGIAVVSAAGLTALAILTKVTIGQSHDDNVYTQTVGDSVVEGGHARTHVDKGELGPDLLPGATDEEIHDLAEDVVEHGETFVKNDGRVGYYDPDTGIIVIYNPNGSSTMFKPDNGDRYWERWQVP